MEMVDYVILFDEPDPYNLIAAIKPQVLAKGGDWKQPMKLLARISSKYPAARLVVIPYLARFFDDRDHRKDKKLRWLEYVRFAEKAVQLE